MSESEARATIITGEGRRAQIERLWDRLANNYLRSQPSA
jgi:hypothetical protein